MEGTSDYMSVMEGFGGGIGRLVNVHFTTVRLNNYLATRTHFQFPVVTDDSFEDIIDYYLSAIEVDQPDEAEHDESHSRLGKFIENAFYPESTRYGREIRTLLSDRIEGIPLAPPSRYVLYLLRLVYERDGPLHLSSYFYWAADGFLASTKKIEEVRDLFVDLGLADGLVYCTEIHIPNRAQLIERMTDRAAQDSKYFRWLIPEMMKTYDGVNVRITYLCQLMSLAKLIRNSSTDRAFRVKFRTYLEYEFGTLTDYLSEIFSEVIVLCLSPPDENDGIDYAHYTRYMVKALAYTEEIYGVQVVDVLARRGQYGGGGVEKALRMLADSK